MSENKIRNASTPYQTWVIFSDGHGETAEESVYLSPSPRENSCLIRDPTLLAPRSSTLPSHFSDGHGGYFGEEQLGNSLSSSLHLMLENEVGKFKIIKSHLLFSHPTRLSRRSIPVIPTGKGWIVGHLTKFTFPRLRLKEKNEV